MLALAFAPWRVNVRDQICVGGILAGKVTLPKRARRVQNALDASPHTPRRLLRARLLSFPHHRGDVLHPNIVEEKVANDRQGVVANRVPPLRTSVAALPRRTVRFEE